MNSSPERPFEERIVVGDGGDDTWLLFLTIVFLFVIVAIHIHP